MVKSKLILNRAESSFSCHKACISCFEEFFNFGFCTVRSVYRSDSLKLKLIINQKCCKWYHIVSLAEQQRCTLFKFVRVFVKIITLTQYLYQNKKFHNLECLRNTIFK
jgi:hypothetical protein